MKATQFKNLWVTGQVLPSAKSLTHGDAGKTFYLNSTTEFETVLPAPKGAVIRFRTAAPRHQRKRLPVDSPLAVGVTNSIQNDR